MDSNDSMLGDRYDALLVRLHESLVAADASTHGSSEIAEVTRPENAGLANRLAGAEACLRLLEHVRRVDPDSARSALAGVPQTIGRLDRLFTDRLLRLERQGRD